MSTSSISFKKKGTDIRRIPGTKFSYRKAQLLTSSGNISLDSYLGGGLAVGTLIAVEHSGSDVYSNALVRYYLAEGIKNNHSLFLADQPLPRGNILENIPVEVKKKKLYEVPPQDELNIAWRYKNQKCVDESLRSALCQHKYDLSESLSKEALEKVSIVKCDVSKLSEKSGNVSPYMKEPYSSVLRLIKDTLEKKRSTHSSEESGSIGASLLRIAILSFGSPLWHTDQDSYHSLYTFLYALRSLLRSAYAVAFVTFSSVHFQDLKLRDKVYQMADYGVRLIPFLDHSDNKNPMTKGFDGLFEIVKLPHLNSPIYQVPTSDLAFKLHVKKFEIKRLRLPPCVDESASGDTNVGCGGPSSKKLDF